MWKHDRNVELFKSMQWLNEHTDKIISLMVELYSDDYFVLKLLLNVQMLQM